MTSAADGLSFGHPPRIKSLDEKRYSEFVKDLTKQLATKYGTRVDEQKPIFGYGVPVEDVVRGLFPIEVWDELNSLGKINTKTCRPW